MQSELPGRTGEEAIAEIGEKTALHRVLRKSCAIDVGAVSFVAYDKALRGHDLKKLEDGGVAGRFFLVEGLVNIPHGGRLFLPQDLEEFQFGFSGAGDDRTEFHDEKTLYEVLRSCQRNSS